MFNKAKKDGRMSIELNFQSFILMRAVISVFFFFQEESLIIYVFIKCIYIYIYIYKYTRTVPKFVVDLVKIITKWRNTYRGRTKFE